MRPAASAECRTHALGDARRRLPDLRQVIEAHMTLAIVDRTFPIDPSDLLPAINADNKRYWESLSKGALDVQCCSSCKRNRFPIVPVCPHCRGTTWSWVTLSGRGKVFSWVRYHRGYLPEFEDQMP